jgi:hypothetical protein
MRSDTIRYDTIRYDTIRYVTMRYDTIRYDTIRYDQVRSDQIRSDMETDRGDRVHNILCVPNRNEVVIGGVGGERVRAKTECA